MSDGSSEPYESTTLVDPKPDARETATDVAVDWDSLEYPENVPLSLYCPVCKNVLLTPIQTSCLYMHTFCARCITRALEERLECPVDRTPMPEGLKDCSSAPKVIDEVLDELKVRCPNEGCTRVLPRGVVEFHMKDECRFQLLSCPILECNKHVVRGEWQPNRCSHSMANCEHCMEEIMAKDLQSHLDECRELSHQCKYCNEEFNSVEIGMHRNQCQQRPVVCLSEIFGCSWLGSQRELPVHIANCSIHMMSPWLEKQKSRLDNLELENTRLKRKLSTISSIRSDDSIIEVSSEYERDRAYLFQTLETLSAGLENMTNSINTMDTKQNHIMMAESMRSKEELAMLRAGLQSLRLQWHHFLQNMRGPTLARTIDVSTNADRAEEGKNRRELSPRQASDSSRVKL